MVVGINVNTNQMVEIKVNGETYVWLNYAEEGPFQGYSVTCNCSGSVKDECLDNLIQAELLAQKFSKEYPTWEEVKYHWFVEDIQLEQLMIK